MIGKARRNATPSAWGTGGRPPCRSAAKKSLSPAPISEPRQKRQRPRLGWTTKARAVKTSGARPGEVGSSSNGAISSKAKATAAKTGTARTTATETSRASQARTRTSRAKSGTPGQAEPGAEPGEATKPGPGPAEPGKPGAEPGKPRATSLEPGPSGSTPGKTGRAEPVDAGKQTPVCRRVSSPCWTWPRTSINSPPHFRATA